MEDTNTLDRTGRLGQGDNEMDEQAGFDPDESDDDNAAYGGGYAIPAPGEASEDDVARMLDSDDEDNPRGISEDDEDEQQHASMLRTAKWSATAALGIEPRLVTAETGGRVTEPLMTDFEYASLIGERATQLEQGYTDVAPAVVERARANDITCMLDLAELEIETLAAPFPVDVHRPIAPNVFEVWNTRELKLPSRIMCESYSDEATALLHRIRHVLHKSCVDPDGGITRNREYSHYAMGRNPI